ncbi:sulfite reductase flavoprotein subunit alpha [Glycocaulis profundi]|nr:sulfite reductase flavoprotein subunit alpha [Glycocaulis profundi]
MSAVAAGAVIASWLAFSVGIHVRHHQRQRGRRAEAAALATGAGDAILIACASQTGTAEERAWQAADALKAAGAAVRLMALADVDAAALRDARRALFVASTTGEGDAPDNAAAFERRVMSEAADLSSLSYGVLALGDRSYAEFCAFGRRLDAWLAGQGARPLFPRIEADGADPEAFSRWRAALAGLGAARIAPAAPAITDWTLVRRRRLNPGGAGLPAWSVTLGPPEPAPDWRAGDIAVIAPRNDPDETAAALEALGEAGAGLADRLAQSVLPPLETLAGLRERSPEAVAAALEPLPPREYSIASLPADGELELIVRETVRPCGRAGIGSGWLCRHAGAGDAAPLRIRTNRAFHGPADDRPMILIGAGTGLAGLSAHVRERAAARRRRNWLIYGERTERDLLNRDVIEAWTGAGALERCDLALSRQGEGARHVQDVLRREAADLRGWLETGAAIYVCGSRAGMGEGVDAALRAMLGGPQVDRLQSAGLYRRDVY